MTAPVFAIHNRSGSGKSGFQVFSGRVRPQESTGKYVGLPTPSTPCVEQRKAARARACWRVG